MIIELLSNQKIVTIIETHNPEVDFETYQSMIPELTSWQEKPTNLNDIKYKKNQEAGIEFARRRDAIRWVDGYGWDSAIEDITNFMAAFTPLLINQTGTTFYKVWTSTDKKEVLQFSYSQMQLVYDTVRSSQLDAYAWYEIIKAAIEACTTKEEVEAITW